MGDIIVEDNETATEGYELSRPIKYAVKDGNGTVEKTITHIKIKDDVEAGDLEVADDVDGVTKKNIAVIAHLSGHPVALIRKLSPKDYAVLALKIQGE
ncbi:phage tail assembly protein [Asticcacaulis sp. YBE204]|uniref:phage tail assembly protein n=1 Tax=Asticcacaulis sp. YBE204 TaxID=1282363 RepID=UPI0003C3F790|nr:phage tail assembly protein [Asticcacaulis sp. YBE204]ESQ78515.1 hypothetical protein AEYBE204_13265 [Asticcacaulis sp. YBE204]